MDSNPKALSFWAPHGDHDKGQVEDDEETFSSVKEAFITGDTFSAIFYLWMLWLLIRLL